MANNRDTFDMFSSDLNTSFDIQTSNNDAVSNVLKNGIVTMSGAEYYQVTKQNNFPSIQFASDYAHRELHLRSGAGMIVTASSNNIVFKQKNARNFVQFFPTVLGAQGGAYQSSKFSHAPNVASMSNFVTIGSSGLGSGTGKTAGINLQIDSVPLWQMLCWNSASAQQIHDVSVGQMNNFAIQYGDEEDNRFYTIGPSGDQNWICKKTSTSNARNGYCFEFAGRSDTSNDYLMRLEAGDTNSGETRYISFWDSDDDEIGYIRKAGDSAVSYQTSDARLKTNVKDLPKTLPDIMKLRPVSFNWKSGNVSDRGLIAQEVQKIYPDLLDKSSKGYLTMRYAGLIPMLLKGIQEQQEQIEDLQKQIDELKEN